MTLENIRKNNFLDKHDAVKDENQPQEKNHTLMFSMETRTR